MASTSVAVARRFPSNRSLRHGRLLASLPGLAVASLLALAAPHAHATDGSVKVGVLTDMAGAFADIGGRGSVIAAELAIADFGGSVLGKPITLLSADPQLKPDNAVTIARRWFDQDGVDLIVDLPSSPIALAVQALAKDKKRITIASSAATDALTNAQCSPYGIHWTYDSYSIARTLSSSLAMADSTWFFLIADNAGGTALQNALASFLNASGAKVLGNVRYPPHAGAEMSSYLLQAQATGAKYIPLAGAGTDLINVMKQAREFGLNKTGQTVVGTAVFQSDVKALGLEAAAGLVFATGWDLSASPEARAWADRFYDRLKAPPNAVQAGVYSGILHYLKAVQAAGTDDATAVIAKMRELPVNDMFAKNGTLRKDGRLIHDMYLVKAKSPAESSGPKDLVSIVKTIPGAEAFRPVAESACPALKEPG